MFVRPDDGTNRSNFICEALDSGDYEMFDAHFPGKGQGGATEHYKWDKCHLSSEVDISACISWHAAFWHVIAAGIAEQDPGTRSGYERESRSSCRFHDYRGLVVYGPRLCACR